LSPHNAIGYKAATSLKLFNCSVGARAKDAIIGNGKPGSG
jgi:hypothetical protein